MVDDSAELAAAGREILRIKTYRTGACPRNATVVIRARQDKILASDSSIRARTEPGSNLAIRTVPRYGDAGHVLTSNARRLGNAG